jgi:hypothetical protein
MKDARLKVFRGALDGLTESLEALVRVTRWTDQDAPPEPLRTAVSKLTERLGSADRLSSGAFVGSPADANKVKAMCATMKRLDTAYVAFRKRVEARPHEAADAAEALETDIAEATAATQI